MRVVWRRHPITASEIVQALVALDESWHPKTVRTLLTRLVDKQALDYEAAGRAYVYAPRVTEQECVAAASESFLDRCFGGSLAPMLAHFVEKRKLTVDELAELKELLKQKEKK